MVHRIASVVALAAILALPATPGGAVCVWAGDGQHGCCAAPEPQPVAAETSCCGDSATTAPSPTPPLDSGCDCIHAPEAPEATTVGTPTSSSDETTDRAAIDDHSVVGDQDERYIAHSSARPLDHGPPIFLSLCTFLT